MYNLEDQIHFQNRKGKKMKRKTIFKKVSVLAIALSMSLTSQSAQMMLPVFAQEETQTKTDVQIENLAVTPRIKSITLSFDLPQGAQALEYSVWRGTKADNLTRIGTATADGEGKTGTYTDTSDVANKIYFYQIKAENETTRYASDVKYNETAAGLDSVASSLLYKDLSGETFDGTRCCRLSEEEVNRLKGLSDVVFLMKATPKAGVSHTQVLMMGKPSADGAGMNNRIFSQMRTSGDAYQSTIVWSPKDIGNAQINWNANKSIAADAPLLFAFGHVPASSRVFMDYNGESEYFSNRAAKFFNGVEGLDEITIGGWYNAGELVTGNCFEGTIDWIAFSDEFSSTEEVNTLTRLDTSAVDYSLSLNAGQGTLSAAAPSGTSTAQMTVLTLPQEAPVLENAQFTGWKDADGNIYQPGESIALSKASPALALEAIYQSDQPVDPDPVDLPVLHVKPGYRRVAVSLEAKTRDASAYDLLRSDSADGTYTRIASITSAGYVDTSVEAGQTYYYKLRSGSAQSETAAVAATGVDSYFSGAEFSKVLDDSQKTFDGTSTLDISDQIPTVSRFTRGSILIRFKSQANLADVTSMLTYSNTADVDSAGVSSSQKLMFWGLDSGKIRANIKVTRASGGSGFNNGAWHTLVFTTNPDSGNVFTAAVDGMQVMNFTDTQYAGFMTHLTNGSKLEIGGYTGAQGAVLNGFKGTIDKVAISSEALTLDEAKAVSSSEIEAVGQLRTDMFSQQTGNTWLFTGGGDVEGAFEKTGGIRNFAHQFEEYIRWEAAKSESGNREIQKLVYSRFVANGAREGNTLSDVLQGIDYQITQIHPRAIVYMADLDEIDAYQKADDKNAWNARFQSDLKSLADKAAALNENSGYLVLQSPHAYKDEQKQAAAQAISQQMQAFVDGLDGALKKRVVLIDHLSLTDTDDFKNSSLDADGNLNKNGHFDIAKQLCDALYGSSAFPYTKTSLSDLEEIAHPAYTTLPDGALPLSADFSGDSLEVTVSSDRAIEGDWVLSAASDTLSVSKTVQAGAQISLPVSQGSWKLTLTKADGSLELPSVSIAKGDHSVQAVRPMLSTEEKTANQKKIEELVEKDGPLTWLFIGDSITHGAVHTYGYDSISQSFQKFLHDSQGLNRKDDLVYNTAISGAIARDTLSEPHKSARVTSFTPDVAIIMLGMNDCTNVTPDEFESHLKENIANLKEANPNVVIVLRTPNTVAGRSNMMEIVGKVRKVAQEQDLILADHAQSWDDAIARLSNARTAGAGNLNRDNLHPTGHGQKVMLDDLIKALGLWNDSLDLCRLSYDFNLQEVSSTKKPVPTVQRGGLSVDAASLVDSGQTVGTATVTVTVDGLTYTKIYDKASDTSTVLTFDHLPEDKAAVVSAVVTRYDAAQRITLSASDPVTIPSTVEDVEVTLDSASGGYGTVTLALGNASGANVTILRAESEDGPYASIGTTASTSFTDSTAQPEKTYWYKAQWTDSSTRTTAARSVSTGLDEFKENASVYRELQGEAFDGSRLIDLSDDAEAVKAITAGTVFFRFRTSEKEEMSLIYGKEAGTETDFHSTGAGSKNRVSILLKHFDAQDTMRLRNDFSHTRADDPEELRTTTLADGQWHTVAIVSMPGDSRTFCWYIDGEMVIEFNGSSNGGLFSKFAAMNQLTIGGYYEGDTDTVVHGFKGAIRDVTFTPEVLTTDQGKSITATEYSEPDVPVVLNKDLLIAAIDKASGLSGAFSNRDAAFELAVANAETVRDSAGTQEEIDSAAKALNQKLIALRKTPSRQVLDDLNK